MTSNLKAAFDNGLESVRLNPGDVDKGTARFVPSLREHVHLDPDATKNCNGLERSHMSLSSPP